MPEHTQYPFDERPRYEFSAMTGGDIPSGIPELMRQAGYVLRIHDAVSAMPKEDAVVLLRWAADVLEGPVYG